MARPPGGLYRFRRLVRRNKLVFAAIASLAVTLLGGTILSSLLALRAMRAERQQSLLREQAEKARTLAEANEQKVTTEAAKSRHVAQFMKAMLAGVGPSVALGRDTTILREILNQTAARLDQDLKQEPAVKAELLLTIGQVYGLLGELNKAEQMALESLAIRRTLPGTNDSEVAESLEILAWICRHTTQPERAVVLLREAYAIKRRLLGDAHPSVARTLYHLALVHGGYPCEDQVETLYRDALATRRRLLGEEHPDIALLLHGFGTVLQSRGKFDQAEALFRQALAMGRKLVGENDDIANSLASLCAVVAAQNRLSEAESLYRELVAMAGRIHDAEHLCVANPLDYLARVLARQGKRSDAECLRRKALAIRRKFLGDEHPDVAQSLDELGGLIRRSDPIQAEVLHREAVAIRKKVLATDRPGTRFYYAQVPAEVGEDDSEAGPHRNLPLNTNLLPTEIALANSLRNLANALRAQGKWDEAKDAFLEAAQCGEVTALDRAAWFLATCADTNVRDANSALLFAERAANETQRKKATFLDTLAATYAALGRFPEAVLAQQEAIALEENRAFKKAYQYRLRLFQSNLPYFEYQRMAAWLRNEARLTEAEAMYRQELTMRRNMFGEGDPNVADCLHEIAAVLQEQARMPEAEQRARECLAIREQHLPNDWPTFDARCTLGCNLMAQQRYAEAESFLRSGCEGLQQRQTTIPANVQQRLKESVQRLTQLYEVTAQPEKAAEWKQKRAALGKAQ